MRRRASGRSATSVGRRKPTRSHSGETEMLPWLFASLRGYRIGWLPRDFIAGLMLAAIAIPGQLATARLAGMPPETGLYAFAAGSLAFAAFGANRFMSVAADSTIAPIFAGALASWAAAGTPHYVELVTLLALMVGAILLVVGLLRAGWLATLLSTPVTTGFLAGIAIHIMVGELPTLRHIRGAGAPSAAPLSHPRPPGRGQSLYAGARRRRADRDLGHGQDQREGSGRADRRGRRGRRRGAVPPQHPRRESARPTPRRAAASRASVVARSARRRPASTAGPHRGHGLHHADVCGREHLSFGGGAARRCQPRLCRRRGRQHRGRLDRLVSRRCESAQHRHRRRIRRPLADRLDHRRRAHDRAVPAGGGADGLCAARGALRNSPLHRHQNLSARRNDPHLPPGRVRDPAGGRELRTGRGAADRNRHAAGDLAVLRPQPVFCRAPLLRGTGTRAGNHRVVAARPGREARA